MINETQQQISARLVNTFRNTPPFNTVTLSPSATAMWLKFIDVIATEIWTLEQLNNTFETEIEGIINRVTTPTDLWWQNQILKFQYNAGTPQVVILDTDNFFPFYNPVVPSFRIITNCAVITLFNNTVQIKVTNNGVPLDGVAGTTGLQCVALQAYIETIAPAGIAHQIINELPDQLSMFAKIFYNGQYSSVIQTNVIAAIDNYLKNIPFNGVVKISEIEDAVQAVAGVTDIVITEVGARRDATPYGSRTILTRKYQSYSGQIIQETTVGRTFADSLVFTVSNT